MDNNNNKRDVASAMFGMAVGIGLMALLSFMFKPLTTFPDSELVARAQETQEVKAFLDRFPDAKMSVDGQSSQVTYRASRQDYESSSGPGTSARQLVLTVTVEQSGRTEASLVCGGSLSTRASGNITSHIEYTRCLGDRQ
ncbi:hypothetical protein [Nitrososphaera viennensis]|uniref:Uncharacterized protein n=2 Tax=Nitrososphaera viennensis TaxID=1034015 RepID=A0A060HNW4_9ARCH|nr:hypothetical protein [Nitrososphaera viennensis]AIC16825.1 hypothetical protein NVIE_025550 [Nitrososphaera viennensis EN76]